MNDSEIISALFGRDESALESVRSVYGPYCAAIAGNILRDERDREECFADLLAALWNSIPPNSPNDLKSYIGKIMRAKCIDKLRADTAGKRAAGEYLLSLEELDAIDPRSAPEDELFTKELSRYVSDFLRDLPQTERGVFIRRYWYYDPIDEISRLTGFGKSKIKMMLKRTRAKLGEYLKEKGYEL